MKSNKLLSIPLQAFLLLLPLIIGSCGKKVNPTEEVKNKIEAEFPSYCELVFLDLNEVGKQKNKGHTQVAYTFHLKAKVKEALYERHTKKDYKLDARLLTPIYGEGEILEYKGTATAVAYHKGTLPATIHFSFEGGRPNNMGRTLSEFDYPNQAIYVNGSTEHKAALAALEQKKIDKKNAERAHREKLRQQQIAEEQARIQAHNDKRNAQLQALKDIKINGLKKLIDTQSKHGGVHGIYNSAKEHFFVMKELAITDDAKLKGKIFLPDYNAVWEIEGVWYTEKEFILITKGTKFLMGDKSGAPSIRFRYDHENGNFHSNKGVFELTAQKQEELSNYFKNLPPPWGETPINPSDFFIADRKIWNAKTDQVVTGWDGSILQEDGTRELYTQKIEPAKLLPKGSHIHLHQKNKVVYTREGDFWITELAKPTGKALELINNKQLTSIGLFNKETKIVGMGSKYLFAYSKETGLEKLIQIDITTGELAEKKMPLGFISKHQRNTAYGLPEIGKKLNHRYIASFKNGIGYLFDCETGKETRFKTNVAEPSREINIYGQETVGTHNTLPDDKYRIFNSVYYFSTSIQSGGSKPHTHEIIDLTAGKGYSIVEKHPELFSMNTELKYVIRSQDGLAFMMQLQNTKDRTSEIIIFRTADGHIKDRFPYSGQSQFHFPNTNQVFWIIATGSLNDLGLWRRDFGTKESEKIVSGKIENILYLPPNQVATLSNKKLYLHSLENGKKRELGVIRHPGMGRVTIPTASVSKDNIVSIYSGHDTEAESIIIGKNLSGEVLTESEKFELLYAKSGRYHPAIADAIRLKLKRELLEPSLALDMVKAIDLIADEYLGKPRIESINKQFAKMDPAGKYAKAYTAGGGQQMPSDFNSFDQHEFKRYLKLKNELSPLPLGLATNKNWNKDLENKALDRLKNVDWVFNIDYSKITDQTKLKTVYRNMVTSNKKAPDYVEAVKKGKEQEFINFFSQHAAELSWKYIQRDKKSNKDVGNIVFRETLKAWRKKN